MKEGIKNIVVFHLGWLGDSVMTIPVMARLRHEFRDAKIVRVINSKMERFFSGCPYADKFIPYVRQGNKVKSGYRLLRVIRELSPDLFVNLHTPDFQRPLSQYIRDNFFAYLTGATIRAAYSYSIDSRFLSNPISYSTFGKERMDREMLKVIEPITKNRGDAPIQFWLDAADREEGMARIEDGFSAIGHAAPEEYFCVSPFGKRSTKEWEFREMADLCESVSQHTGSTPVFLGGTNDTGKMKALSKHMRGKYVTFVGQTDIKTAAAIIERAKVMVTVDSGLMHLAALLGVPVVAIFGPGNPVRWHPIPLGTVRIFSGGADCAPCFLDDCSDKTCFDTIDRPEVTKSVIDIMEG
ncbi:MAG: hypothetical protein GTN70_03145 [Deltaproteobacteria bacterium]|nr:hypothetical protein [Deltaproteobacteria bacterium]NIS76643.1 hypothetical protein [Deltaproteobacteria bacterium]